MKRLLFSILAILVMTAGCTYLPDGLGFTNQPPTAWIDSISPPEVSAGETVTFDGHGTDADGDVVAYRWRSSLDGDLSAKASFETSSLSEGVHIIYLKVQDNNGDWSDEVRARVIVSGVTAGAPVVNSFDANPGSISLGASSTLSWNVSGATTVSIDQGIGNVALTGTRVVSPSTTMVYTLTATNAGGSVTATAQVIVSGAPPAGLPVINSFTANPGSITAGDSSTLSWNVSNAQTVTIDPEVGAVDPIGNASVWPAATTLYTLTASNATGWVSQAISVVVSGGEIADTSPPSTPMLLSPVVDAVLPQKTAPWSFDWADSSDPESSIKQYQIQAFRPAALPFIDAYTTNSNYSKVVEVAYPYISNWRWKVRAQNNAGLWSDWSAERTFNVEPRVAYDFVEMAPTAYWWSKLDEELTFPGPLNDDKGFACYRYNIQLNDDNTYAKVLETHPRWVSNGLIGGKYSFVSVPAEAKLKVKVGFISGAADGKVKFTVGKFGAGGVISQVSAYADGVEEMEVSLDAYAGQTIDFALIVYAYGSSEQDWAAWVEAKIIY